MATMKSLYLWRRISGFSGFMQGHFVVVIVALAEYYLKRLFSITRKPYLFLLILSLLWLEVLLAIAANVELSYLTILCHFIHLPLWLVIVTVDTTKFSESFQKKLEICLFIMVYAPIPTLEWINHLSLSVYKGPSSAGESHRSEDEFH